VTLVRRATQGTSAKPVLLGTSDPVAAMVVPSVTAMETPDFVRISQVVYLLSEEF
jgi:hypothetical protein